MSTYTLVQSGVALGPFTGNPHVTLSGVGFGNILVAFWINGNNSGPGSTGVDDNLGNLYLDYSQSAGSIHNVSQGCTQLWAALNVKGGTVTIEILGTTNYSDNRQALIVAEFSTLGNNVQVYGTLVDTSGNNAAIVTGLGNNATTNNPGPLELQLSAPGSSGATPAMVALALMNQFKDLFVICGFFLNLSSDQADYPWTFTSPSGGTVVNHINQGNPSYLSACLAYQDFPYIGGNLTIDCNNPPNGTVNVPYDLFLEAYGGTPPYTFSIVGGALPPGLSLNTSTGEISGTPTTSGKYNFTVEVTDSLGATATTTCSISICPAGGGNLAYYARC